MNQYNGPVRRLIKKTTHPNRFRVEGTSGHIELKGGYISQEFEIQQKLKNTFVAQQLSDQWMYEDEKDEYGCEPGSVVPFRQKHTITDSLLLNKTFDDMNFQPEQGRNFLKIDIGLIQFTVE